MTETTYSKSVWAIGQIL